MLNGSRKSCCIAIFNKVARERNVCETLMTLVYPEMIVGLLPKPADYDNSMNEGSKINKYEIFKLKLKML